MTDLTKICVLVVDDDSFDRALIREHLRYYSASNPSFVIEVEEIYGTAEELSKALDRDLDAIIVDYTIPGGLSWPEIYPAIRDKSDVPIIVISGAVDDPRGFDAITIGAADYLSKREIDRIGHAVHRAYYHDQAIKKNHAAAESLIKQVEKVASKIPPG